MTVEYFIDVAFGFVMIPGAFGVDDHGRAEFAALEAAGTVDANIFDAEFFGAGFHIIAQFDGAAGTAAAARMIRRPRVLTAEYVGLVMLLGIIGFSGHV